MKAVVYKTFGPPEVLKLVNHPLPQRSAGEVLVKIRSTSVNPVDYKIRKGSIPVIAKKEKVLAMCGCVIRSSNAWPVSGECMQLCMCIYRYLAETLQERWNLLTLIPR